MFFNFQVSSFDFQIFKFFIPSQPWYKILFNSAVFFNLRNNFKETLFYEFFFGKTDLIIKTIFADLTFQNTNRVINLINSRIFFKGLTPRIFLIKFNSTKLFLILPIIFDKADLILPTPQIRRTP